ncbi:MAG: HPF/RaiA family ribosome-associated protein [Kofleriaceae bacterium]
MKIELRFRGLPSSSALREHVVKRVRTQLSRFGTQLSHILVRLEDVNGPRGGRDKRCLVTVRGPGLKLSPLEQLSDDAYAASALALERVSFAVGRELQRGRTKKRGAPALRDLIGAPA